MLLVTIRNLALVIGVYLVAYSAGTPGDQILEAIGGGLLLGTFVGSLQWGAS